MSNRDGPRHWLGIYLNDHLAGATAGAELARRVAGSHQDPRHRKRLAGLAADIAAANDGQVDQQGLRVLLDHAGDQLAVVEELRIQAGAGLFSPG
jgi:hypothetical protein